MVCRDDVTLVSERAVEIRPNGVVAASGEEFEVDVVVLATGFKILQFLWPMEIRGRSGSTLRETWGEYDARAYLGVTVPDFPNLFILNGPNTNAGHGGSAILATEFQVQHTMRVLAEMIETGAAAAEVTEETFKNYNEEMDEALSRTIWSHQGMTSYFRNDAGRIVVGSPWAYLDYWNRTRAAVEGHYHFEQACDGHGGKHQVEELDTVLVEVRGSGRSERLRTTAPKRPRRDARRLATHHAGGSLGARPQDVLRPGAGEQSPCAAVAPRRVDPPGPTP